MSGQTTRTLTVLRETLRISRLVWEGALTRGDTDLARRQDERIIALEQHLARLDSPEPAAGRPSGGNARAGKGGGRAGQPARCPAGIDGACTSRARRRVGAATAGREAERLHLARELHDGPLRALTKVGHEVADCAHAAAARGEALSAAAFGALAQEIGRVQSELRGTVGALRPPALGTGWLPAALAGEVARLRGTLGSGGPLLSLAADPAANDLPEAAALALYRVAQEALCNAVRHARACRITVVLRCEAGGVTLRVSDDGRGFQVPATLGALASLGHYGLVGLGERMELVGGWLRIRPLLGNGTTIVAWLPLAGVVEPVPGERELVYH
jgi:two-component system sensor histidine kinase UhpB